VNDRASATAEGVSPLSRRRQSVGWLVALVGVMVLTAALVPHREGSTPTFGSMLYLAVVVVCALVGGRWPALAASGLGFLCLNYFFVAPLHTLDVANRLSALTLATFVLVSVAVSAVVDTAERRRVQATRARAEAATLAALNERILSGTDDVPRLLGLARETFGASSAAIVPEESVDPTEGTAVRVPPASWLQLRGASLGPSDTRVLAAFATHLGVIQQREELAHQTAAARELEEGNRTRTALIAAVSHDLRTPLAGIRAAAETLRRADAALSASDRAVLLLAIEDSTDRLTTIVADLLDMSRLQTGAVLSVPTDFPGEDVVDRALASLPDHGRVTVEGPLPVLRADAALLERVLANVVANALRHTDGPVEVSGRCVDRRARISVVDHGPGVAPHERARMFEPFQRLGDRANQEGVGLGLAVARGLTEAQGGRLLVEDTPGGGLTMIIETAAPEHGDTMETTP
jgi:two-component system sensor histidine kinase KdpD